jgi:hypothetical protein
MFRLWLLALPVLAGCSAGADEAMPEAAPAVDPITGPLVLSVREVSVPEDGNPAAPELFLFVRTEEGYGCAGDYPIVYGLRVRERVLDLEIEGLGPRAPAAVCALAPGPVTARITLDSLDGTYTLRLAHLGGTDSYRLTIRSDRVELVSLERVPPEVEVSRAEEALVWRFPVRSFAYSCGAFAGQGFLCEGFERMLHGSLTLATIAVPDSGYWPYPTSSQGPSYDTPAQFYSYEREEDFQQAGALLAAYSRDVLRNYEGDMLSLVNWRGEAFYSWMLDRDTP